MIIGICGHKGSGKDYLGAILRKYTGFKIVHFADPLKEMIAYLLNISIDELNDLKNHEDRKICNTNMRSILQKFGTEIMQKHCGKDFWVKQALTEDNIIIPDVRFKHEFDATPPATAILFKFLLSHVKNTLFFKTSTIAFWNEAATSALLTSSSFILALFK